MNSFSPSGLDNAPLLPDRLMADPVGIGLRTRHYPDFLDSAIPVGWLEIHPENYLGGGLARHVLDTLSARYPFSFHSVSVSLGSATGIDVGHLMSIKKLIDRYDPVLVSDHVAWSQSGNAHLNDLLPLPYTDETLDRVADNIDRVQQVFGRQILVENPSTYLQFDGSTMTEPAFIARLVERTQCGLILDINNIYVQAHNHDFDAYDYIRTIPREAVGEMHMAGHIEKQVDSSTILLDTHGTAVKNDVWDLYRFALDVVGVRPTLIEWDTDVPALDVLLNEVAQARRCIAAVKAAHTVSHAA